MKSQPRKKPATQKPPVRPRQKGISPQVFLGMLAAAVLVLVFVVMGNCLRNGFSNWDDPTYIENNPLIRQMSLANIRRIFTEIYFSNYQPLHIFSYLLEYHWFKMQPYGYHLVSLLMHAAVTVMVAAFALRFSGSRMIAAFTALLFAVHPMHVESVAWVAERKDLLYAFFFFASMTAYLRYIQSQRKKDYVIAFVFFLLSIFSKAMAAALPPVLVLTDMYYRRGWSLKTTLEKVPFFLVAFILGGISVYASARDHSINTDDVYTFTDRLVLACDNLLLYAGKLILPLHLSGYYPYPAKVNGALPGIWYIAPVAVAALAAAVVYSLRYTRIVFFCTGFFFLTVLLVLQLLPVGPTVFSERYSYIPSAGLFMLGGYGLVMLQERYRSQAVKYATAGAVLVYAGWLCMVTADRCKVWKDPETFWTDVISKFDNVPVAFNNRGHFYNKNGRKEEAMKDFNQALVLNDNYDMAHFNRGSLYGEMNRFPEALDDLNHAIHINGGMAEAYKMRGQVFAVTGRGDSAMADFRKALELQPDYGEVYYNMGVYYFNSGKRDEACKQFMKGSALNHGPARDMVEKYCK